MLMPRNETRPGEPGRASDSPDSPRVPASLWRNVRVVIPSEQRTSAGEEPTQVSPEQVSGGVGTRPTLSRPDGAVSATGSELGEKVCVLLYNSWSRRSWPSWAHL